MKKSTKNKVVKNLTIGFILTGSLLLLIKLSGLQFLKAYVQAGIGTCKTNPILCLVPSEGAPRINIDKGYLEELALYRFDNFQIRLPKNFLVVKEITKKMYYKKMRNRRSGSVAYLLAGERGFFLDLFPESKKMGIADDYEFLRRLFSANLSQFRDIHDAFFIVLKSVFIPDLGQGPVQMFKFDQEGQRGFVTYGLTKGYNYFDCDVFDERGRFFKVYIRDKGARLDLEKVATILSSIKHTGD